MYCDIFDCLQSLNLTNVLSKTGLSIVEAIKVGFNDCEQLKSYDVSYVTKENLRILYRSVKVLFIQYQNQF